MIIVFELNKCMLLGTSLKVSYYHLLYALNGHGQRILDIGENSRVVMPLHQASIGTISCTMRLVVFIALLISHQVIHELS